MTRFFPNLPIDIDKMIGGSSIQQTLAKADTYLRFALLLLEI